MESELSPNIGYVPMARRRVLQSSSTNVPSTVASPDLLPKPRQKLNFMVYMFRALGVLWTSDKKCLKWCLVIVCHFTIAQDIFYQLGALFGFVGSARSNAKNFSGKFLHLGTLLHTSSAFFSIHTIFAREEELLADIEQYTMYGHRSLGYFLYVLVQDVMIFVLNSAHILRSANLSSVWRIAYEIHYVLSSTYVFYHTQYVVPWLVITCISVANQKVRGINEQLETGNGDRSRLIQRFRNVVDLCCANSSRLAAIVYTHIVLHVCFRVITFSMMVFPCLTDPPRYAVPRSAIPSLVAYLHYVLLTNIGQLLLMSTAAEKLQASCKVTRRLIRSIRLENNTDNEDLICAINLVSKALGLRVSGFGIVGYRVMMSLLGTIFSWMVICYQMSYSDMACLFPPLNATRAAFANKTARPAA